MRTLDDKSANRLSPGADHYRAYVGPPTQYDFMGATQFALLFALGMREHHKVLDFGCGSLRAGRLLIPYLDPGCYFGIEPNTWLIDEGVERQLGRDILSVKRPSFSTSDTFSAEVFGEYFDIIVAQSIFSHGGTDIARTAIGSFANVLAPAGIGLATFIEGDGDTPDGWRYPGIVTYRAGLVQSIFAERCLVATPLPWFHPRQTWWLFAAKARDLPPEPQLRLLRGIVLRAPEFAASVPAT